MSTPDISRDEIVAALVDILRDELADENKVLVPGLGSFRIQHRPSRMEKQDDENVVVKPPHNDIIFVPET